MQIQDVGGVGGAAEVDADAGADAAQERGVLCGRRARLDPLHIQQSSHARSQYKTDGVAPEPNEVGGRVDLARGEDDADLAGVPLERRCDAGGATVASDRGGVLVTQLRPTRRRSQVVGSSPKVGKNPKSNQKYWI